MGKIARFIREVRFTFSFLGRLFVDFIEFFFSYVHKHLLTWGMFFESHKNMLVRFFTMKRGRYNRPFLHVTALVVVAIGIIIAPFLAETYPVFSGKTSLRLATSTGGAEQSIEITEDVFQTDISQKPRSEIVIYTVQKGDTISTIAKKFGISADTVRWVNNLTSDYLTVDDELKILPVTGIAHKVYKGDTVYTIAKRYDTEAQKIVDFPFNDFVNPETFSLVEGQMLVVPDGVKPSEQPTFRRQVFIASGPVNISSAGFTWPLRGVVSQFASWYHMALDITSPVGTPIVAAQNGRVTQALVGTWDGGYGTNVMIGNDDGYQSLYSHLSGVNVAIGDTVIAGKTVIGWVGMTGRTTGPHVHFEIRRNGVMINPLLFLN